MKQNDLKPGDILEVGQEGVSVRLIVDGKVKDALLGSQFMGNTRVLMHSDDYAVFKNNEIIAKDYSGQVCCIDTHDTEAVQESAAKCSNINFANPRSTVSMCYVMDMIVAFIVLILSACLIILSFVVLKVSLSFTITREYREIGVMKAIGIKNRKIRVLYLTKYFAMAIAGSLIGFFLSIPLSNVLMASVTENMVLGNDLGYGINAIGAILVVITIVALSYFATRIVKKATPVDAIRTGSSGERYSKKSKLHLSRAKRTGTSSFLAINDTISSPKRYISIVIAFTLCMLFVLMMVNTTNTMQSEKLITAFGTKGDVYVDSVSESMKIMGNDMDYMNNYFDGLDKKLQDLGIPGHFAQEWQYTYNADINGKTHRLICEHGFRTDFNELVFTEGTPPQNRNEVAVTSIIAKKLNVKIGDTMVIDFGSEKLPCIITAYYQSFNQLGEVVRLHPDAEGMAPVGDDELQKGTQQIAQHHNPHQKEKGLVALVRQQLVQGAAGHQWEGQVDDGNQERTAHIQQEELSVGLEVAQKNPEQRAILKLLGAHVNNLPLQYFESRHRCGSCASPQNI